MKHNDENLGHKWKWNGDVKQCQCGQYLGTWNGKSQCPSLSKKKKNRNNQIALDEYSSSSGYGGWGHDD